MASEKDLQISIDSSFILFFQVKSGRLICDGKNRTFSNIFDCIKTQWSKIAENTKVNYKNEQFDLSVSTETKCQEFYQSLMKNLKFDSQSQNIAKGTINYCRFCKKSCQNLDLHLITKHAEHIYPKQICRLCQEHFILPEEFYKHFIRNHNYKNNNKINNKKGRKKKITEEEKWLEKNTCKECQVPFATMSQFKYHRLKTHGKWQGTFKCEVCLKQFSTMSNLRKHEKIAHSGMQQNIMAFLLLF